MAVSETLRKKLEKRKQQIADKGKGFGYISVKEGKLIGRILSAGPDADFAEEVIFIFFSKEIGGFISPATFGMPCAAYEAYNELKKSKDEDDNAIASNFKPRKGYLCGFLQAKDEKGKEFEEEATLLKLTGQQYTELIEWMLDDDYGDFTDDTEGYPIKFKRTGTGQYDTVYTQMKLANAKVPKKFRGKPINLEEMIKKILPTYEETQEKLNQFLGIDNEEDEAPKKKKKKGSKEEKTSSKKSSKDSGTKKKKKKTSDI